MSGECDLCGEHAVDCVCDIDDEEELEIFECALAFSGKHALMSPDKLSKAWGLPIDLAIQVNTHLLTHFHWDELMVRSMHHQAKKSISEKPQHN